MNAIVMWDHSLPDRPRICGIFSDGPRGDQARQQTVQTLGPAAAVEYEVFKVNQAFSSYFIESPIPETNE